MNPSALTPVTINRTYIGIVRINFTIQITNDTHRNNAVQTISRIVQSKILPIPDLEIIPPSYNPPTIPYAIAKAIIPMIPMAMYL